MIVKIGEAAKLLGVSVKTLQRWDNDGTLVAFRNPKNQRYYTDEQLSKFDVGNLKIKKNDLVNSYENRIVYVDRTLKFVNESISKHGTEKRVHVYFEIFPYDKILTGKYFRNWGLYEDDEKEMLPEQTLELSNGKEIWEIKHMTIGELKEELEREMKIQDELDEKYPYLVIGRKFEF